jgi:hypothetical protein
MAWQKSSLCKADPDLCAEVYGLNCDFVSIRDSKRPHIVVSLTREEWEVFINGVKLGDFDLKTNEDEEAEDQMEQV